MSDTHYTPSWTSVPSHHPHPEKTWNTLNHKSQHTLHWFIYCHLCHADVSHLPQQYWYFPSCHSHRGEQSRQAVEREQPVFVLTAKSWLPAWLSFGLTVSGRKIQLKQFEPLSRWGLLIAVILISPLLSVYIPPECGQVTLPRKLYFLRTAIS